MGLERLRYLCPRDRSTNFKPSRWVGSPRLELLRLGDPDFQEVLPFRGPLRPSVGNGIKLTRRCRCFRYRRPFFTFLSSRDRAPQEPSTECGEMTAAFWYHTSTSRASFVYLPVTTHALTGPISARPSTRPRCGGARKTWPNPRGYQWVETKPDKLPGKLGSEYRALDLLLPDSHMHNFLYR